MSATVAISSITIGNRHRRDMGDLWALANSIAEVGLLHPIGALASGELVFGERRLRACRDLLGWTDTERHEAMSRSVAWQLANPTADAHADDYSADDGALAAAD